MRRIVSIVLIVIAGAVWAEDPAVTPLMGASVPGRESLAEFYGADTLSWEEITASGVPADVDLLVWACHTKELPAEARSPQVVNAVKNYLSGGGALFLSSFAEAWVIDLGLETVYPNRMDQGLFGGAGSAPLWQQGFKPLVSHPIFAGLQPSEHNPGAFYIAGAHAFFLESGFWENQTINAQWLASYFRHNGSSVLDGTLLRTVNLWTVGQGEVLGYAHNLFLEDYWHNPHRANLHRFLRNVAEYLTGESEPSIRALPETPSRLHADVRMAAPAHVHPQPHSLHRDLPGLPYVAHWGWLGAINYQRVPIDPVDLRHFKTCLIDEPRRWGGNLLEFYPPDMSQGFPFAWEADDPIPPPQRYWGGSFWPAWSWQKARELIEYAHQRDFIIHTFYHPDPVQRQSDELSADIYPRFVELQAREVQNSLLYGREASQDGLGLEGWYSDTAGDICKRAWMYNPGSYIHSTATLIGRTPNFTGTWQCAWGRVGGVHASGFGDRFRYLYHPPLYLGNQADCRDRRTSNAVWGSWSTFGGGSYPDWLVRQMDDFARVRLYLDTGIWWLGEPEATLRPEFRDYVYVATMEPCRRAVTTRLHATGRDGFRAKSQQSYADVPPEWANAEPYPQDTGVIQNNYLRLLRMAGEDRGILQYDPTRTAFFHATERPRPALDLSPSFMTAVPLVPEKTEIAAEAVVFSLGQLDNSNAEFKGSGGYSKRFVAGSTAAGFPGQINYESTPSWPQEIEFTINTQPGRHVLRVHILPVSSPAIVEVSVDGDLVDTWFPTPGQTLYEIGFSVASLGAHTMLLSVQRASGAAASFDKIEVARTSNQCARFEPTLIGGHRAEMRETVVSGPEGAYRQERTYRIDGDSPALFVHLENVTAAPTGWETRMSFPLHPGTEPLGESAWRLVSSTAAAPDLLLFVQGLDVEKVERRGADVGLAFPARQLTCADVALVVADGLYGATDAPALAAMLFAPTRRVSVEDEKPRALDNPHPAPRVEVVEVASASGGPFMVAETGARGAYWTARGGQPLGQRDYLKLYFQAGGSVKIQPYGFIDGIVKPGWGCQYTLAVRDNVQPRRCEVEVVKTGPFMFAPRIEWKEPFDTVLLDGKPWRYFEDNVVYLPNRPGHYVVEVSTTGQNAPRLARTFLSVERAAWNPESQTLDLSTSAPHYWSGSLPSNNPYTAQILCASTPTGVEGGGRVVPWSEYRARSEDVEVMAGRGAMVELYPGPARIHFGSFQTEIQIPQVGGSGGSHWFGYYDKYQFDQTDRYVLGMEVGFDTRDPLPSDEIKLGMVDRRDGHRWIEFATTNAWCWQQGTMLQWIPGSASDVVYNVRAGDGFGGVVHNPWTGEKRALPRAVYSLHPGGRLALSLNFARLDDTRPGYGYEGPDDPFASENYPAGDGIYLMDIVSGTSQLIISYDQLAHFQRTPQDGERKHWVNVLLFNPSGTRFAFVHRWYPPSGGYTTRLMTANTDGSGLYVVDGWGSASHFQWYGDDKIVCWTNTPGRGSRYHLFTDQSTDVEILGQGILTENGHMSYSPNREWLLTDTYPNSQRLQTVMLFRPADNRLVVLGRFYSPPAFTGTVRCDTHPRWSRDGKTVCIDSAHSGRRQMYLIDVGWIVGD
ncbi:hypothetical protein HS125_06500 [bacterium]|nr:hypothetical protein [bacterium]